jgi:hypothetical protein
MGGLEAGPTGKRRESYERITMSNFFDYVRRKWTSAGDGVQKGGNFIRVVGTAVSEEKDGRL